MEAGDLRNAHPGRAAVELPWPAKELSPNARVHFQRKAAAARHYRESAHWLTIAAKLPRPAGAASLRIDFHPPDRRARDLDNMLASIKSGLDGVADALEVNDSCFRLNIGKCEPVKGGKVVIVLEAA